MKLILVWLASATACAVIGTAITPVLGVFALGVIFIGVPWLCWKRWKNPKFFDEIAQ